MSETPQPYERPTAQPSPPRRNDEGGLRAPPELHGWRKAWWWFDFLVLVKLARLRFVAILVLIGVVITQWDLLVQHYDRWFRPAKPVTAESNIEYFCPMHPTVVRDNPIEKCPICFMPLSKREKGDPSPLPPGVVSRVQLSPYRVALAGVQTFEVDLRPLSKTITAVGYVEFNERLVKTVSARVKGRIDALEVNETGQMVAAGDVLASIYSPELLVSVDNLLVARRGRNEALVASARTRLELLGISDDQIDEILRTGKANTHLKIRSPIAGHVIRKYVREGEYVDEGSPLYDVADLSTVWIQAQIYEDDLAFLPAEQHEPGAAKSAALPITATTRSFPDETFEGRLAFIYPHIDQATRTVTVRFELDNPGHKLRPGATATVRIEVPPADVPALTRAALERPESVEPEALSRGLVLAVPDSAAIDTGTQKVVYRQSAPGLFEGISVELGPRMSSAENVAFYPVLGGLKRGETVVTAGSFLIDAETRLNPAAGSIYFGSGGSKPAERQSVTVRPSTPEAGTAAAHGRAAALSPADRLLADKQQFCAVLEDSRLGSMGAPVKLLLEGEPVFLCCEGCRSTALARSQQTLEKARALRSRHAAHGGQDGSGRSPADELPSPGIR